MMILWPPSCGPAYRGKERGPVSSPAPDSMPCPHDYPRWACPWCNMSPEDKLLQMPALCDCDIGGHSIWTLLHDQNCAFAKRLARNAVTIAEPLMLEGQNDDGSEDEGQGG